MPCASPFSVRGIICGAESCASAGHSASNYDRSTGSPHGGGLSRRQRALQFSDWRRPTNDALKLLALTRFRRALIVNIGAGEVVVSRQKVATAKTAPPLGPVCLLSPLGLARGSLTLRLRRLGSTPAGPRQPEMQSRPAHCSGTRWLCISRRAVIRAFSTRFVSE